MLKKNTSQACELNRVSDGSLYSRDTGFFVYEKTIFRYHI